VLGLRSSRASLSASRRSGSVSRPVAPGWATVRQPGTRCRASSTGGAMYIRSDQPDRSAATHPHHQLADRRRLARDRLV